MFFLASKKRMYCVAHFRAWTLIHSKCYETRFESIFRDNSLEKFTEETNKKKMKETFWMFQFAPQKCKIGAILRPTTMMKGPFCIQLKLSSLSLSFCLE